MGLILLTTLSYSQNTQNDLFPKLLNDGNIVITPNQLRNANKLFLEVDFLKDKIDLTESRIKNYEDIIINKDKIIHNKNKEIQANIEYRNEISKNYNKLNQKYKKSKKRNKNVIIVLTSGLVASVLINIL